MICPRGLCCRGTGSFPDIQLWTAELWSAGPVNQISSLRGQASPTSGLPRQEQTFQTRPLILLRHAECEAVLGAFDADGNFKRLGPVLGFWHVDNNLPTSRGPGIDRVDLKY